MAILEGLSSPLGMAVVPGGSAASPLSPVPGLNTGDSLVAVRHINDALATNDDVLTDASIPDVDQVQLGTTDTTGDYVVVVWKEAS